MAAGWKPKLIVETLHQGVITTTVGLDVASRHTSGRHVSVVPDEQSSQGYIETTHDACDISLKVMIGEIEEVLDGLVGIDFMVVDCRQRTGNCIVASGGGVLDLKRLKVDGYTLQHS